LITIIRLMKRSDLTQKLSTADASGVWAFTPASFSALMGGIEPAYLKLMTKRLSDQGVLIRAARGVYVNPNARSKPPDARRVSYASFDRGRSIM
jgi:hypothetical protein